MEDKYLFRAKRVDGEWVVGGKVGLCLQTQPRIEYFFLDFVNRKGSAKDFFTNLGTSFSYALK